MARELSEETARAEEPTHRAETPGTASAGIGRSHPSIDEEKRRLALEQGEAIASGRASKGHIVLRTPLRRAIFVGGLAGIALLALLVMAMA